MPQTYHPDLGHQEVKITLRRIAADRPLVWLRAGWQDLKANPIASLSYGLLFAIAGDVILLLALPHPHLFSLAVSGFFLIAPLLAAGLYEISRRHERGLPSTFVDSLAGWQRNGESIALFGLGLALVGIVWERISAILFALLYSGDSRVGMSIIDFVTSVAQTANNLSFISAWFIAGGCLALLVFALTAISVPMLLDRSNESGGDLVTATLTSLRAVLLNLDTMILWGAIIVTLTLIGFASLLFGLIVLMPLLGHASWHAYRELVEPGEADSST
jgi:uncharacterized membrane protein